MPKGFTNGSLEFSLLIINSDDNTQNFNTLICRYKLQLLLIQLLCILRPYTNAVFITQVDNMVSQETRGTYSSIVIDVLNIDVSS